MVSLKDHINKKGLNIDIVTGLPSVYGDKEHVEMIFSQLLSNATKFSSEKSVITIGYNDERFLTQNEGPGIKPENIERVFNIFFTTCRKTPNCTGAGLYITKKLVDLYGGYIRIENMIDNIISVELSLPIDQ